MFNELKTRIKHIPFFHAAYLAIKDCAEFTAWNLRGRPVPPPHFVKQRCIVHYSRRYGIGILVETGTFKGDMVRAVRPSFQKVYSIELSHELYLAAKKRFITYPNVYIIEGDSAVALDNVLQDIKCPCLFWLDAHYSSGITARSNQDTPILAELTSIFSHNIHGHVILIDDARMFDGTGDYPSLSMLQQFVFERRPESQMSIADDIIRILPPG